jgi:glycosyltransferase involved in cell wall biosynthesis
MRILQIIDSLDIGGAEKMAVTYANSLAGEIEFSGLVTTRKEGELREQINNNVDYFFLNRKRTLDVSAVLRLKKYCQQNRINILHAHSSSFLMAFLVKLIYPKVKLIWHDHNGLSEFLGTRDTFPLKVASYFFDGIIVVNCQLKKWAEKELNCNNIIYLSNYTVSNPKEIAETDLYGKPGKRILCLANLRFQKNHFLLLKAAQKLLYKYPDWTIHLVGKDFKDEYSEKVRDRILFKKIEDNVFIYDSRNDIQNIIKQCDITVLSSQSEGLPVAILEYGLYKKPVISTDVGEIANIIKNNESGFVVDKFDVEEFYNSMLKLVENESLRVKFGENLYQTIMDNNSEKAVVGKYLTWIEISN